jgi:RimJ/RimL family protein N-acetyltransferase
MIYLLDKRSYEQVHALFSQMDHQLTALAVIEGSCPGSIWVDSIAHPRTAFMASPEGHFLVGHEGNSAFNEDLNKLIRHTLLRKDTDGEHVPLMALVCHPEEWSRQFDVVLAGHVPIPELRLHYLFERALVDWRNQIPVGSSIERLDEELLGQPGICIPDHVRQWMVHNWGSLEGFLRQGLGFCAVRGHEVVSWCLTDCRSGNACEIGIRTHQEYRRQGLATLTVAATVEECLCQGLTTIGWHCHEKNLGSRGVAEKTGFVKEREYMSYRCLADQAKRGMTPQRTVPGATGRRANYDRKL